MGSHKRRTANSWRKINQHHVLSTCRHVPSGLTLETLLLQDLEEGRVLDGVQALSGQVVDGLLVLGHTGNVVVERGHLLQRLGRVESQELGELGSVSGVLVNSELEVLAESLVELGKVVLVLGDLGDHVEGLLDNVLWG